MVEAFYLHGGGSFSDLEGLMGALAHMDDAIFAFHTDNRNDFASWVESCVRKPLLGALLRECETKHEMLIALETYDLVRKVEEPLISDVVRRVTKRF